jgi:K+/H+ antiporter YhaU regulatory subunit KhtT
VGNSVQALLTEINDLSRQLLSSLAGMPKKPNTASPQIDSVKSLAASKHSAEQGSNDNNLANADNAIENLMPLIQQRQALIEQLFSEHRPEQISLAAESLQQMVDLDNALTEQASNTKQSLKQQVIALKNSKKVNKSYQKY